MPQEPQLSSDQPQGRPVTQLCNDPAVVGPVIAYSDALARVANALKARAFVDRFVPGAAALVVSGDQAKRFYGEHIVPVCAVAYQTVPFTRGALEDMATLDGRRLLPLIPERQRYANLCANLSAQGTGMAALFTGRLLEILVNICPLPPYGEFIFGQPLLVPDLPNFGADPREMLLHTPCVPGAMYAPAVSLKVKYGHAEAALNGARYLARCATAGATDVLERWADQGWRDAGELASDVLEAYLFMRGDVVDIHCATHENEDYPLVTFHAGEAAAWLAVHGSSRLPVAED